MKKSYSTPEASVVSLATGHIVASSPVLPIDPSKGTTTQHSQRADFDDYDWDE